jgi:hypothetical protein
MAKVIPTYSRKDNEEWWDHFSHINREDLYIWCLQQVIDRFHGRLCQEKIDKLDCLEFPWEEYQASLDKLFPDWRTNKNWMDWRTPDGKDTH